MDKDECGAAISPTDRGHGWLKKAAPAVVHPDVSSVAATMIVTIKAGQGQVVREGVTEIHYGVHEEEGAWVNVVQGDLNNFYSLADVTAFSVVVAQSGLGEAEEEAVCWGAA